MSWTQITVPASLTSFSDAGLSAESAEGVFVGARSGFIEFVWWVPPRTSQLIWWEAELRLQQLIPDYRPAAGL